MVAQQEKNIPIEKLNKIIKLTGSVLSMKEVKPKDVADLNQLLNITYKSVLKKAWNET